MARSVHFHPLARSDLLDIYTYIESRSGPEPAGTYIDRVEQLCRSLAVFPNCTRPRNDLMPGLRTMTLERRVLVVLTVTEMAVTILRVLYAGRDLTTEDIPQ